MANTNIDLVGLDFNSLKNNLKSFLKNNTQFKDLDYEGSNINVLLDVLAYNTYLNAFYTNMVASEMFLDTAQLRDSVVSHAKELNYTPRSFASAQAQITVDITPASAVTSIVVPQYTSFTTRVGSNTYTFSTNDTQTITKANNGIYSINLTVYEGIITTETFVVSSANSQQRFVLSNPTIDVSSLVVSVYEDGGQNILTYLKQDKLLDITNFSPVYFVQGAENQQYELVFGDNVFGRRPKDGSTVVVKYRISSGQLPNGATTFVPDSAIDGQTNITVKNVTIASGGSVSETIDSIRYNAPRNFQSQERAVTSHDYETLLLSKFSDIQAISVYGGEEVNPPQFGKVFISVDLYNTDGASEARKRIFKQYISDRSPLTIDPVFVNPTFMYVKLVSNVYYNVNNTTKSGSDILTAVQAAISNYSKTQLENFKTTMYYSSLVKDIDQSDPSILSNDTTASIVLKFIPVTNAVNNITIDSYNAIRSIQGVVQTAADVHYGENLTSSTFTYLNVRCILVDDMLGNIFIAALRSDYIETLQKIGTIDYALGRVQLVNFNISSFDGNSIEIYLVPQSKNISGVKNIITEINPRDVTVNVIGILT